MERPGNSFFSVARVVVLLLAATLASVTMVHPQAHFGTLCQADYQNNWRDALPYSWDRCGWFNDELDDTDLFDFYWNLHGARTLYGSCDGCAGMGADTVSLLYTNTHGGAVNDTDVRLVMWDQNIRARSNTDSWRLGDESTKLSIFANYACETLTNADSSASLINRWRGTFRGGLRMALGSHDKLYDSVTTNECGEDFADNLQDGETIKWAWFDGNGDWSEDQDVKVLATGTNESNCISRKNTMKWQNFGSFTRLRDGDVNWYCSSKIDNN
jgi:hypothetical protein